MSDPSQFKDIHQFDRRWEDITIIPRRVIIQDKMRLYRWIYDEVIKFRDQMGILGLQLIIKDTQKTPNYDPINNVFADDILAEIGLKTLNLSPDQQSDIFKNINEQMNDMFQLGRCPQGRALRLFQIYKTIKDL